MTSNNHSPLQSDISKLVRLKERGHYDRETIYPILDDGILCHIGFEGQGRPFVLPTAYIRYNDQIMIHGSVNSRFFKQLAEGTPCCVTVTYLDGLVLARSAFHHSVNYRSVVIFGTFSSINTIEEKRIALDAFVDASLPGRLQDNIRPSSDKELNATAVLVMDINEASAKIRTGPPKDDKKDYDLPVWAGVVEKQTANHKIIDDPKRTNDIEAPSYLADLRF